MIIKVKRIRLNSNKLFMSTFCKNTYIYNKLRHVPRGDLGMKKKDMEKIFLPYEAVYCENNTARIPRLAPRLYTT